MVYQPLFILPPPVLHMENTCLILYEVVDNGDASGVVLGFRLIQVLK